MKSAFLAKALVLTVAVAISLTPGCRRKPKGITPIPQGQTGGSRIQNPNPVGPGNLNDGAGSLGDAAGTRGGDLGAGGVSSSSLPPGVKAGENIGLGGGQIQRDMYNADRAKFASDVVYFDFDSSVVKTSEKSKVGSVIDYLKSNATAAVEIEGHCDERGTEEYNRSLGERRALALREEIALAGIDPARVYTISFGEDKPAASGHNESAWSKNRRGEFILLTPK